MADMIATDWENCHDRQIQTRRGTRQQPLPAHEGRDERTLLEFPEGTTPEDIAKGVTRPANVRWVDWPD